MTPFHFSVCPHDTAKNVTGWFLLNTYLQRNLNCAIRFEPKDNFIQERECVLSGKCQIVYANPFSAAIFRKTHGYIPIAKPRGIFDETVLVCDVNKSLPNHRPIKVASATDKLVVHTLGLALLEQQGLPLSDVEFQFVGTHLKATQSVIQGKADLAFVYNETWNEMSDYARQALAIVGQTESRQATHCFCVSPEWSDKSGQIQKILCTMQNNPQSQRILDDLHFPEGFGPMNPDDLEPVILQLENRGVLAPAAGE